MTVTILILLELVNQVFQDCLKLTAKPDLYHQNRRGNGNGNIKQLPELTNCWFKKKNVIYPDKTSKDCS